jgi:hypothetical protein
VIAAALLNSLRRHILTQSGHWSSPGNPHSAQRKPAGSGRVHARAGRLRRLQPRSGS